MGKMIKGARFQMIWQCPFKKPNTLCHQMIWQHPFQNLNALWCQMLWQRPIQNKVLCSNLLTSKSLEKTTHSLLQDTVIIPPQVFETDTLRIQEIMGEIAQRLKPQVLNS